ncbi:EAL domain-containing protein [Shewanella pneumatophori]|uniref:EAL domain-containing protein n=1 Tax=Shewanella pneumatophori TaxID=314092 RepID=A0A9X1Z7Z9_9GAMM|nr:EAL domain-containing protein [Shewanella pneumatophori]MCL1137174.1 EAL domain-containing protein [Shewanella pneumatophori]
MKILIVEESEFVRSAIKKQFVDVMTGLPIIFENTECSKSAINTLRSAKESILRKINLIIIDLSLVIDNKFALMNYMVKVKDNVTPVIIIGSADRWVFDLIENLALSFNLNLIGSFKMPLRAADIYNIIHNNKHILATDKTTSWPILSYNTADIIDNLNRQGLCVYYQPKIHLETKRVVGFEALSRICIDGSVILNPDVFLPILERENLTCRLTKLVLENALFDWETHTTLKNYQLSVNICADDLISEELVSDIIKQYRQDKDIGLTLEITESTPTEDETLILESIKRFITNGIEVSLDDFGKSYSSLDRLDSIPFDEIKIDKSFVSDMDINSQHQAIVGAIIELGSKLRVKVTAEGVETASVVEMLKLMNCRYAQGYYYSAPIEVSELISWIDNYNKQFK